MTYLFAEKVCKTWGYGLIWNLRLLSHIQDYGLLLLSGIISVSVNPCRCQVRTLFPIIKTLMIMEIHQSHCKMMMIRMVFCDANI